MTPLSKTLQYLNTKYGRQLPSRLSVGAVQVELRAKQKVSIDTGNLQDSITTFPVQSEGLNVFVAEVGTKNVPYAGFIEKGRGKSVNYYRGPRRSGGSPNAGRQIIATDNGDGLKYLQNSAEELIDSGLLAKIIFDD